MSIKDKIRTIPDFPKPGIMFRDITSLLGDANGLKETIDDFVNRYRNRDIDIVAGVEARGFILGSAIAYNLGLGFVPLRKKGKLPGKTESLEYALEYGTDTIEVHVDSIEEGARVLLIDDLLATGGTCLAAAKLVEKVGGKVEEIAFIVNLPDLKGSDKLKEAGYNIYYQCEFEGD